MRKPPELAGRKKPDLLTTGGKPRKRSAAPPDQPLKPRVEAALFATGDPLTLDELAELLDEGKRKVKAALLALAEELAARPDGALVVDGVVDGEIPDEDAGFILTVKGTYSRVVEQLVPMDLSQGALRTLAVIALKGPIPQKDLVDQRGAGAYDHVKELEEQGLIHKEPKGRSFVIRTSTKFGDYFKADPTVLASLGVEPLPPD